MGIYLTVRDEFSELSLSKTKRPAARSTRSGREPVRVANWALAIVGLLSLSGCLQFSRVPFKYTSFSHIEPKDSFVQSSGEPEDIVFALTEHFRANGVNIVERKRSPTYPSIGQNAAKCWRIDRQIIEQEFNAYRNNNYSQFKHIDREGPYKEFNLSNSCVLIEALPSEDADAWYLRVQIDRETASTSVSNPSTNSFFVFSGNTVTPGITFGRTVSTIQTSFKSSLQFWVFRKPGESKSTIHIQAKPINNGVEANLGSSIGYAWWQHVDGVYERNLVRNYILLFEDAERKGVSFKTVEVTKGGGHGI